MTPDEVDAFLAERRPMTMCSISPDGSIHAVAMWYGFLDGCVTVETKAKSQKAQNLRRDPRLTLLFEDGDYYEELRGVELVGKAEIIEDPERLWALGVSVFERYYAPVHRGAAGPSSRPCCTSGSAIKLHVERTVSWDHRKLGLPSHPPGVKIAVDSAGRGAAGRAIAAYGSPAFYEDRRHATTSRCSAWSTTRTAATGS